MDLDEVDWRSATWKKLKKYLQDELQDMRERNDKVPSELLERNQGEIRRLKAMIALDKPKLEALIE